MINSFFRKTGFYNFGSVLNKKKCLEIQKRISNLRKLDKKIFYSSEKEFMKKGRFSKYSPGTNEHNLLVEDKNFNLDFIEKSPRFKKCVSKILGKNYKIMKKKYYQVCSLLYTTKLGKKRKSPMLEDQI